MGMLRLYEVRIDRTSNPNYTQWLENVGRLRAVETNYAGIGNLCIVSHTQDAQTVHLLCTDDFKGANSRGTVTVTEITRKTLNNPGHAHHLYQELVQKYFLPHGTYPNV